MAALIDDDKDAIAFPLRRFDLWPKILDRAEQIARGEFAFLTIMQESKVARVIGGAGQKLDMLNGEADIWLDDLGRLY
ncbi:hypothetical protein [Hyphomicrobium methylovorum]|uniref:hypothetical protein n=1 Tax=Hyphomicrobium methylovorum TaxID=84 RepID=UPI0015E73C3C|nr:hypothetical protein [Hyphomicrobium methylovorum]